MASIIEDHPQREQIDRFIMAGKSLRAIHRTVSPTVSFATIQRYRNKALRPIIPKAAQAIVKQVLAKTKAEGIELTNTQATDLVEQRRLALPLVERLAQKQRRREHWLKIAETKEDIRGFAAIDTAETRDIELEARLTGALDTPAQHTTNALVIVLPRAEQPAAALPFTDVTPDE